MGLTHHPAVDQKEPIPIDWILEKMNGKSILTRNPTLTLRGDSISAYGGCNGGFGKLSLGNGKIKIRDIGVTSMACMEKGILEQESNYYTFLGQVDSYNLDKDRLVLTGKDVRLEFKKQELEKDVSFTNTKWNLNSYSSQGMVSSLMRDSEIYLSFTEKEVTGFAGCSQFRAKVLIHKKETIFISNLEYREADCLDKAIKLQEDGFLIQFPKIKTYAIQGKQLTITTKEGENLYFIADN